MRKLDETKLLVYSFGLFVSSLVERIITYIINTHIELETVIYHTISMVLLVILFVFTNILLKRIMRSDFACRVALGKTYVAGRWLEATYKGESEECIGYCCFDIDYDEDGINIRATNYGLKLNINYTFTAKSASVDDYTLRYMYMRNLNGQQIPDWGSITFQPNRGSSPTVYEGNFERDGELFRFKGVLVMDKKDILLLDKDFKGNFKAVLTKYNKDVKMANE